MNFIERIYQTNKPIPDIKVIWDGFDFKAFTIEDYPREISFLLCRNDKKYFQISKIHQKKRIRFTKTWYSLYEDFFGKKHEDYKQSDPNIINFKNKLYNICEDQQIEILTDVRGRMDEIVMKCVNGHTFYRKPHSFLSKKNPIICTKCGGRNTELSKEDFIKIGMSIINNFGPEYLDYPQSHLKIDLSNYKGISISPLRGTSDGDRRKENNWQTYWENWDDFRKDLGLEDIDKRQKDYSKNEGYTNFFLDCCRDLNRIPTISEFLKYKNKEFNGSVIGGIIRKDYLNYVEIAKKETGYDFITDYFIVDGILLKSLREVYFYNFLKLHNIDFDYEPVKIDFGNFKKVPDFYIKNRDEFFEVCGYFGKTNRVKLYWDKIETAKEYFNSNGYNYTVWDFSYNYTSLDFYKKLCNHFGVNELDYINSEVDIVRNFLLYEKDTYTKMKEWLAEFIKNIKNYNYKSKEWKKARNIIKRLNLVNLETAANILEITYSHKSGNGHIIRN